MTPMCQGDIKEDRKCVHTFVHTDTGFRHLARAEAIGWTGVQARKQEVRQTIENIGRTALWNRDWFGGL